MRTVQEIYEAYRIMPGLQLHQLRVAACAVTLAESVSRDVSRESVLLAGLFHDMANIIKSDLTLFPELLEPEGQAHWELVKRDFLETYGTDEHRAALQIAREIGLSEEVRDIIGGIGFSKLSDIVKHGSLELKIAEYSDLRVGPHGVLSMQARIDEGTARYRGRGNDIPRNEEQYEALVASAYALEQDIFSDADIAPEDITEAAMQLRFADLRAHAL